MSFGDDKHADRVLETEPRCADCRFFYITWELEQRYGCRAFAFKSQVLPSQVVLQVDGRPCNSYRNHADSDSSAGGQDSDGKGGTGGIDLKI
jgi:hypothetical protein